jgi:TonB family protein
MADLKNDIEKYLRGELSSAERNALERKALQDPFLADALEGSASIQADEFRADLQSLHTSLHQRVTETKVKVVPLWMWSARIAAGLLIIAVGTFLFFQLRNNDPETVDKRLSEHTQKQLPTEQPSETSAVAPDSSIDLKESKVASKAEQAKPAATEMPRAEQGYLSMAEPDPKPAAPALEAEKDAMVFKNKVVHPSTIMADSVPITNSPVREQELNTNTAAEERKLSYTTKSNDDVTVLTPEPTAAKRKRNNLDGLAEMEQEAESVATDKVNAGASPAVRTMRGVDNAYVISGKVTDAEDGDGLPGVNVLIKGTNYGTVTDGEGNYQIKVDEPDPSLVFTFIGMENKEVHVDDAKQVDVAMIDDMTQLNEIVVVGYGAEKMEEEIPGRIEFANPMGGRAEFKRYLEGAMRYPQQALANDIEGKVTIQFTVQVTGDISDFKVVRGIGYGCEDEVIRLIKSGPKWNPTRKSDEPVVGKVKVKVKFRLPGK